MAVYLGILVSFLISLLGMWTTYEDCVRGTCKDCIDYYAIICSNLGYLGEASPLWLLTVSGSYSWTFPTETTQNGSFGNNYHVGIAESTEDFDIRLVPKL